MQKHLKSFRRQTAEKSVFKPNFLAITIPFSYMKPRIVVADDNTAFLAKLVSVLATEFEVVAAAEDGKAALQCVRLYEPNVVVLDLEMPGLNAIEVIKELAKYPSSPAVVICSIENDPDIVEATRKAGALGYVFKPRITQDLIAAVKSVASGQSFVSPL